MDQKCKCGTVINFTDLNDLEYHGYQTDESGNKSYILYYTCPYCDNTETLSHKNLDYVSKWIIINEIDLTHYEEMANITYSPHIEKDRVNIYDKYHAYWIHFKYGVKVPYSSEDDVIYKKFINNNGLVDTLTMDDGSFIDYHTFNVLLSTIEQNELHEILEAITHEKHAHYITAVEYSRDYNSRGNSCGHLILKTNTGAGIRLKLCDKEGVGCFDVCGTDLIPKEHLHAFHEDL